MNLSNRDQQILDKMLADSRLFGLSLCYYRPDTGRLEYIPPNMFLRSPNE